MPGGALVATGYPELASAVILERHLGDCGPAVVRGTSWWIRATLAESTAGVATGRLAVAVRSRPDGPESVDPQRLPLFLLC
jgi:hypothetical protein